VQLDEVAIEMARRMSTGNQGVALMHLAGRAQNVAMAGTAVQQIEAALQVMRAGGHAPAAAFYEARLPEARAVLERLKLP
jgi:hypothetical protein